MLDKKIDIETLGEHFQSNPFLWAGYRALFVLANDNETPEEQTVPLLRSIFFMPAIIGFLTYKRMTALVTNTSDVERSFEHLISITSTSEYRSYTLVEVAKELQQRDEDVLLLCSPSAEGRMTEWQDVAPTVKHRDLHRRIPVKKIIRLPVDSVRMTLELKSIISSEQLSIHSFIFAHNLLLLELIKHHSIVDLCRDDPAVHTLKPMPYFLEATKANRIYVYQHGTQVRYPDWVWPGVNANNVSYDLKASIPFYIPLTYFVWGEPWKRNFERIAHRDSVIHVTGSPWYDNLASTNRSKHETDIDVLFVSQSHAVEPQTQEAYEELVKRLVEFCSMRDFTFAVKLHPRESMSWYEKRGLDEYVQEFDDIDTALLRSRVAVTDTSTAFIEASVLGTPSIVADVSGRNLSSLAPVKNVRFTDGIGKIETHLEELLGSDEDQSTEGTELIRISKATDEIIHIIRENN